MSTAPVAVVQAWIDAINRREADQLAALSSPDVAFKGRHGATYGVDVRDWLAHNGLTLTSYRVYTRDHHVVVEQHGAWRTVDTGAFDGEAAFASRFEVEDGRVAAYERHEDLGDALAAAGLGPADETSFP